MTANPTVRVSFWPLVLVGAAILMVTMGARQSMGLFINPMSRDTGLSLVDISFALAIGQFVWGAAQPVFGVVADRWGPVKVIMLGGLMLAAGTALTPFVHSEWMLIFTLGFLAAAGAGAGSFSILIGAAAQRLPADKRSTASGVINAGGSFGQLVFAPLNQALINTLGWMQAMWALALLTLSTLPLAWKLGGNPAPAASSGPAVESGPGIRSQVALAFRDRSYWCLHLGFFTCGFHIAFLVTHLPGEVGLCGLSANVAAVSLAVIGGANIIGSLAAGALGNHYRMKYILFWMYATRAVAIAIYLAAPKTPLTFYVFAAVLGLTWLATVPPTAGLVGKLFGTRHLATLFGLTLLSHQIGGFCGAYFGGLAFARWGSYEAMWWADIALAAAAALINLPIREARLQRALQPAH
jgi:predicted MFS family arabinose efflux permease